MTVYVVQEPLIRQPGERPSHKYSLEPARKYGELQVLLEWRHTRPPIDVNVLLDRLHNKLRDFTPDDYLLLAGNPVAIACAAMVAASYTDGRVKMLQWDRNALDYSVHVVDYGIEPEEITT